MSTGRTKQSAQETVPRETIKKPEFVVSLLQNTVERKPRDCASGGILPVLIKSGRTIVAQALISLGIFHASLPRRPSTVLRQAAVMFRVFDAALTGGAFPIDGKAPVLIRIFHAALSRRAGAILSEAPVAGAVLDLPLTGRPGSVLRKTLVARRILHATLSTLLDLRVRSRIHGGCFLTRASGGFAAILFCPGRHAGIPSLHFCEGWFTRRASLSKG